MQVLEGTNAYAIMQSPRASGAEAIVISAPWLSRTGEGDGTPNLRGVATVLALAPFLKSKLIRLLRRFLTHVDVEHSLWAKDLVFVISDGYLDGMHAWITTYHGAAQPSRSLTVQDYPFSQAEQTKTYRRSHSAYRRV